MFFDWVHWTTVICTLVIVVICVIFHYEGLRFLSRRFSSGLTHHRARIVILILGQLCLHIVEIWIFAAGYYFLLGSGDYGALASTSGVISTKLLLTDYVYYSAVVYSTLGFGDLVPTGAIRFLTGMEAIAGLVLITWSASFTFLEMQRNWTSAD